MNYNWQSSEEGETRKGSHIPSLHDRLADPVGLGIVADGIVLRIDQNDLEVLVRGVLVDPVRVEHAQVATFPAHALLGDGALVAGKLELSNTLVLGLTVLDALLHRALPATAAHAHAVHDVSLLRLVADTARLVRTSRPRRAVDGRQLAVLPGPDAAQEAQHIALLVAPELLEILVGTHDALSYDDASRP